VSPLLLLVPLVAAIEALLAQPNLSLWLALERVADARALMMARARIAPGSLALQGAAAVEAAEELVAVFRRRASEEPLPQLLAWAADSCLMGRATTAGDGLRRSARGLGATVEALLEARGLLGADQLEATGAAGARVLLEARARLLALPVPARDTMPAPPPCVSEGAAPPPPSGVVVRCAP
jgi:hypothetical protein